MFEALSLGAMEQLLTTGEMEPSRVRVSGPRAEAPEPLELELLDSRQGILVMDSLGAIEQFEKLAAEEGDLTDE